MLKKIWMLAAVAVGLCILWWMTRQPEPFEDAPAEAAKEGETKEEPKKGAAAGADCKKGDDCESKKCMIKKDGKDVDVKEDGSESGKCGDADGKVPEPPKEEEKKPEESTEGEEEKAPEPTLTDLQDVVTSRFKELDDSVTGVRTDVAELKPTLADIQDKVATASVQQTDMAAKLKDFITGHPMEPGVAPDGKNLITAPGSARPLGSTSERPTYPAAVDVEPSTFETYVQTLVKSEMAAQGKPVTEGFQLQQILTNVKRLQTRA